MKHLLHRIDIRNFKAFRDFSLTLEGRHLLLYGSNGSGKSSLYWSLYTFLQSARKPQHGVAKYFQNGNLESLLNIHEQAAEDPKPGEISMTLRDPASGAEESFRISEPAHETFGNPLFEKADMASDFITYRFFFGFSHFRNSEHFNLWKLFEHELLPFCVSTGGVPGELEKEWRQIRRQSPNPNGYRGVAGAKAFRDFNWELRQYCEKIKAILGAINAQAQTFYDDHFSEGDPLPLTFKIKLEKPAFRNVGDVAVTPPELRLIVAKGTSNIPRPQSHLNEAKMTQLAISIRFAASLIGLQTRELKLLVLDDLLVSFDMDNRMRVVEILLSETFENCQKIILTHDLGFFQEFRRLIGRNHAEWCFSTLVGTADEQIRAISKKSDLETAQDFLALGQIAECGNCLRKAVETNLSNFLEQARRKKGLDGLVDRETFASLHHHLHEASSILSLGSYHEFAELLHAEFTLEQLRELVSSDEVDHSKFAGNTKQENKAKGDLIGKIYAARPNLHQCIIDLLSDASRKRLNALNLIDEVRRIKDRILNPASHAGTSPLYSKEAEDAIKVIQALETALTNALETLSNSE